MVQRIFNLTCLILFCSMPLCAQQSFTLQEAIDYALEHNTELRLKQIELADAEANIMELRSIGMPKVTGGVNFQHYLATPATPLQDFITPIVIGVLNQTVTAADPIPPPTPVFFEFSPFTKNNFSASVDANWLAFDGSFLAAVKAAKLFREMTANGSKTTEQEIRNNIVKAYMNVLILDKNRETLAKNLKNLEKSIFEMEEMYKEGFIGKLDVSRLELSRYNLSVEQTKLDQVEHLSKNILKFQMNYPVEEPIELSEDLDMVIDQFKIDNVDLDEDIDYSKRAELEQIDMGIALNDLNVERLKRTNWPSVRLFATLSESLQRNDLFDSNEGGWIPTALAGVNVNVPIYDGNLRKAQIERATLDVEKAKIQRDEFKRGVLLQVENAKIQYINAKANVDVTEKSLALAEEIHESELIKFKEGVGLSIEITQAESALYAAQSNYINALYNLLTAKTDLDIALGKI